MKKYHLSLITLTLLLGSVFLSCKKDPVSETPEPSPQPVPVEQGTLVLEFRNTVDTALLVYGKNYVNLNGDTFKVSKFNYYISNIVLTKEDNSVFVQPDSYRIIQQADPTSMKVQVSGVPVGNYKSIQLMLGVDSAKNNSGAHTGGLDFTYATDMFWGWNTGYIFLKLEGTAPTSTISSDFFEYHIGGFGGVNKTQRTFNLNVGATQAKVATAATPTVHLKTDLNEFFTSPATILFSSMRTVVSPGLNAKKVADNYADMIKVERVQNP